MFPQGYPPGAQIMVFAGLAILVSGVAFLVGIAVFPPFYALIPGRVVAGLLILGIGLSLAVGALVGARPSDDTQVRRKSPT